MKIGTVDSSGEALVSITVEEPASGGQQRDLVALLDTGFGTCLVSGWEARTSPRIRPSRSGVPQSERLLPRLWGALVLTELRQTLPYLLRSSDDFSRSLRLDALMLIRLVHWMHVPTP